MGLISNIIDIILHLDKYIGALITTYGPWTYGILFFVIFLETGFVFTPFLPGDSLIFAAGTMAGSGLLNIWLLYAIFVAAAVLGDTANYWIGRFIGTELLHKHVKFLSKRHLEETEKYFDKYGSETIILARFVPFVRTFAPFLAGVGEMDYWKFFLYNFIGGITWVALFCFGGYFFGNLAWVQEHFTLVILIIIFASVIPPAIQYFRVKFKRRKK